jgi:hypothetical protein
MLDDNSLEQPLHEAEKITRPEFPTSGYRGLEMEGYIDLSTDENLLAWWEEFVQQLRTHQM